MLSGSVSRAEVCHPALSRTSTAMAPTLTFWLMAAMLVINLRLGLLVLAIVPILAVATVIFRRKSSQAYTEARERISVVNAPIRLAN